MPFLSFGTGLTSGPTSISPVSSRHSCVPSRALSCTRYHTKGLHQRGLSLPKLPHSLRFTPLHPREPPSCSASADALITSTETSPTPDGDSAAVGLDANLSVNGNSSLPAETSESDDIESDASAVAPKKTGSVWQRIMVGIALGLFGGLLILTGKKMYVTMICLVVYQVTQEYYGFITSKGMSKGMKPPPPFVSVATTILCISITIFTSLSQGRSGTALAIAAFSLLSLNIVLLRRPTFSQLASSLFGLFYCGYLPSFWVKLRWLSAIPPSPAFILPEAVTSLVKWNVGLLATFTSVACIIAADTGAYFVGKNFGRTKLTEISPKKTVEGAVGGLVCSMSVAVLCSYVLKWPQDPLIAAVLGVCIFITSLMGDLIESIMKREAGLKDSGNLLPGHGGLLDRFDSYIFTGAMAYFFATFTAKL